MSTTQFNSKALFKSYVQLVLIFHNVYLVIGVSRGHGKHGVVVGLRAQRRGLAGAGLCAALVQALQR